MNKRFYDISIGSLAVFLFSLTILVGLFIIPVLNPFPESHKIVFGLNYPDIPNNSPIINETEIGIQVLLKFTYTGVLSENNPIKIGDSACEILSKTYKDVDTVQVGFPEAIPWQFREYLQNGLGYTVTVWGASFQNYNNSVVLYQLGKEDVYFPVSGEYSPVIVIKFNNGTAPIIHTYDMIKVHVLSETDVNAQSMNRINIALTIALLVFSYIEGFSTIGKLWKKRNEFPKPEIV
jgi:hypothetical protein